MASRWKGEPASARLLRPSPQVCGGRSFGSESGGPPRDLSVTSAGTPSASTALQGADRRHRRPGVQFPTTWPARGFPG